MSILTLIICVPLATAVLMALVPGSFKVAFRGMAIGALLLCAALAVAMFARFDVAAVGAGGFRFQQLVPWVAALKINYHVGVDGISVGLVLMSAVVALSAACLSWEIGDREKEFYILLLIMAGGIFGAFSSLDLFFLYAFHELALIPTFIMIGVWGRGERRNYAAWQITIYLSIGALMALAGLIVLYLQPEAGTFDIPTLTENLKTRHISLGAQSFIFPLLLFGFGILVSLWPFHTWAPLGYSSAPTPTAMLHAGALKKFGLYGLIRIALPMLPEAARHWMALLALLSLGNLLYCGWVAMRQKDFNWLISYSSVAHMGFVFLGIASLTVIGVTGAVLVMVAHGFLAALTFGLAGYLQRQTGTLQMDQLGGLLHKLPFIGTALTLAAFAGCGLPGFANFAGEITVLFGAWKAFPRVTSVAAWSALLVGAIYMLRAIRNMLHGPAREEWAGVADASHPWRKAPFVMLLAALLLFGCLPRLLTDKIRDGVQPIIGAATAAIAISDRGQWPKPDAPRIVNNRLAAVSLSWGRGINGEGERPRQQGSPRSPVFRESLTQ